MRSEGQRTHCGITVRLQQMKTFYVPHMEMYFLWGLYTFRSLVNNTFIFYLVGIPLGRSKRSSQLMSILFYLSLAAASFWKDNFCPDKNSSFQRSWGK